jgi:hypothetical protein
MPPGPSPGDLTHPLRHLRTGGYGLGRDHVPIRAGDAPDAPPDRGLDAQLTEALSGADAGIVAGRVSVTRSP